jgi:glycosyltransferase involved in cell wall biosynthesis
MNKLLTIGIPTFNRAHLLDKQLAWLAQAVKGYESECEIIISDNCSTDETPEVIRKWEPAFSDVSLKLNRNTENIGAVRNIVYCQKEALGKYIWVISDDDRLEAKALSYVVQVLTDHPDLALLILNLSTRSSITGKLQLERCFYVENDKVEPNGKAMFERYLADPHPSKWGGLSCITANVCRTDLARRAIDQWPSGLKNITLQLYVVAYCALHGSTKISKEPYIESATGTHFFMENNKIFITFRYAEVPEVFVKLREIGVSPALIRSKVLGQRKEFRWGLIRHCLRRWPTTTISVFLRYLIAVLRVHTP